MTTHAAAASSPTRTEETVDYFRNFALHDAFAAGTYLLYFGTRWVMALTDITRAGAPRRPQPR